MERKRGTKTSKKEIKNQCQRIKQYWSQGWDDDQIRTTLKLTMPQFENRLKWLSRDRFDVNRDVVLLQYESKKQRRYDQLEALSLSTKDDKIKLECIQEMGKIDENFVAMGQRLGIFPEAPKKFAGMLGITPVGYPSDFAIEQASSLDESFKKEVINKTQVMLRIRHKERIEAKTIDVSIDVEKTGEK